jgi:NTP pyrophosphatase (non-canonical NTP hydrolase)
MYQLLVADHPVSGDNIALHTAEEVGECIGAYNKLTSNRGSREHFGEEWAQAMLMLTMLGQHMLSPAELELAMHTEMVAQRKRWRKA